MKALFAVVLLLAAAPLRAASDAPAAADWHKSNLPAEAQSALRGEGFRLEDDGRVLDPASHAALTPDQLAQELARINLGTQRLALEKLGLLLAHDPMSDSDRAAAKTLEGDLPDDVVKALESNAGLADLKKITETDLAQVAAYFDGTRTADERAAAATPVLAGDPGPRAPLPYFSDSEQSAGNALRAAAVAQISKDPVGRATLARLDGPDGKPDLPPVVIEDLSADVAQYDYRRRALVVDRSTLIGAITDAVAPKDRFALAQSLASRQALLDYVNAHPSAVAAFAAKNDVLLVHELTHAWQDRRDPVMQEMARGTLPQAMVLDYEVEAWTTKNLYIQSKLKHDPGAAIDPFELADYQQMTSGYAQWVQNLKTTYASSIVNAMDIPTAEDLQRARLEAERARPVATREEQTAKAQDLAAMTRAQRELRTTAAAEDARLKALRDEGAAPAAKAAPALLAGHYLAQALAAGSGVDFDALIQKAGDFAAQSGDAALIAKVRAAKARRP